MTDFQDGSLRTLKRKHNKKEYDVLIGKLKDSESTAEHSYHYDKSIWTEKSARSHCDSHDGSFEPAAGEKKSDDSMLEVRMSVKMNSAGKSHAMSLIASGKIDKESSWSFSAADGDKMLGDPPDWESYGKMHMGIDESADKETKAHYKYPFGKNGKVYRSALIAIKQRGAAQKVSDVVDAADACMTKMDGMGEMKSDVGEMEKRTLDFTVVVESRADGKKKLCGHAAVFNEETVIGNWFREMIMPGAFTDTISADDQRALFNHDPNFVLGRTSAGTLKLSEDKRGLYMEIEPPDTQLVRDLVLSPIERGDVNQMSFSFRVKGSDGCVWEEGTDGKLDLRKIVRAQVFDVSPVTFPAYSGTDIALRSQQEWRSTLTPTPTPEKEPDPEPEDIRSNTIDMDIRRRRLALITKEVANG